MTENILSPREEALFAAELGAVEEAFFNAKVLAEFCARFIDALPWGVVVERIHPLFPARICDQLFERRIFNRAERAVQKFGGRFGVVLRPYGSYSWRYLISQLEPQEIAAFARALLPVLQDLGFQDPQRRYAEAWITRTCDEFIGAVNQRVKDGKTVVFITSRTDFKPLREAIALRSLGWRCFLVHLEPLPDVVRPMFVDAFDQILSVPLQPALLEMLAARMHPDVFHVHCAMWHYHLGKIVIDNKGGAVCACEFNDITSFYANRQVMSDYWSTDLIDRDWAMERYICNKADLLIHQWNVGMEAHWRATHGGVRRVIEMQPYPVEGWVRHADSRPSQHDGIIRLVWAGQIPGRIACPPVVFDAYYLGEAIEKLLQQGFAVEAYQNPMFTTNFSDPNFEFYRDLNQRFPRHFAIKPGVRLDRLPETLSSYDFGLCLFDVPFHRACAPPAKTRYMMTNKLSTYFEAGIPIIVNWEYESMADFVTENGFGIALRTDEIADAMEHVRRFDREAAVKRIKQYNRDHLMQGEIKRLLMAYEDAARGM